MEINKVKTCLYESMTSTEGKEITIENYIGLVQYGANQDAVIQGRKAKQEGDIEAYKRIKANSKVITPTGIFESGQKKVKANLIPNGLVCIDIDTELSDEQVHAIYNDKYSFIVHKSFGGDGYCVFIKIDPTKIDDAYDSISKYYYDNYKISTDQACKNSNRLRYLSFDPDVLVVTSATKFNVRIEKKDKAPINTSFVFTDTDFDYILDQIKDRSIDLCKEDYYRYVRIGLAIASHFGEAGLQHFHFICSFGSKYNHRHTERDYKGFCKNRNGDKVTIGTFYYYCKEEGIQVYTEKTKTIINRVKVSKSQGNPTIESVVMNLEQANNIIATEGDKKLIAQLIHSNSDFSKNANDGVTQIDQLINFIIDSYDPTRDVLTQTVYINGNKILTDIEAEDIYLECKRNFDFNVSSKDVNSILGSNKVRKVNSLQEFINDHIDLKPVGVIDSYIDCILPQTDYNRWAFKKWIVGAVHNWLSEMDETLVSPLTLVLTGQDHGIGKTSFFRNILPKRLYRYFVESKISGKNKDAKFRMCTNLIMLDDEFGGNAFKDQKEFKDISDKNIITDRLSYGKRDVTWKRRAALAGTCNELDILKDVTGNRRILPINVTTIDYDKIVNIDKESLIMEAYSLLKDGFDWKIYKAEDRQYIYDNTRQNQAILPVEEIFFNHFSLEHSFDTPSRVVMNQGEILEYLNKVSLLKPTSYQLKEVIIKNKMNYSCFKDEGKNKKGYVLYMKTSDYNDLPPF